MLGLLVSSAPVRAADPETELCVEAHGSGQELRLGGHWIAATKRFQTCSAAACPQPVTQDCTRWHDELRALTPSILVIATKPDGEDTLDMRLVIDGASVAERLPTRSIDLDPGEHTIRLEHTGWPPIEQRIVVREREEERRVSLRLAAPAAQAPRPITHSRSFGLVMLGVGGAAAATGLTFGISGRLREDELASSPCGRNGTCATSDVDVVRQRYWIAGVAGGVGVAALAIGLYYLIGGPADSPARSGSSSSAALHFID